jgi:hypothetical protein
MESSISLKSGNSFMIEKMEKMENGKNIRDRRFSVLAPLFLDLSSSLSLSVPFPVKSRPLPVQELTRFYDDRDYFGNVIGGGLDSPTHFRLGLWLGLGLGLWFKLRVE